MDIITARGQQWPLLPGTYWHLAARDSLLLHNVPLSQGVSLSMSMLRQQEGMQDAVTPYLVAHGQSAKELIWEQARRPAGDTLPSRLGAMFVVESRAIAEMLASLWFAGEDRHLLAVRVVAGSAVARLDARWLDGEGRDWPHRAASYWRGELTDNPLPEVLVHGVVYFPDWQSPPFGLGALAGATT